MATCNWANHQFTIYEKGGYWNDVAGVYIFAGVAPNGNWNAYYIGICDSFKDRLPNHERWAEAARLGATHVHALVAPLAANRQAIEKQLIAACQPRLNTQHK